MRGYGTLEELLKSTWDGLEEAIPGSPAALEEARRRKETPGSVYKSRRLGQECLLKNYLPPEVVNLSCDWTGMLEMAAKPTSAGSSSKLPFDDEHVANMAEEIAAVKRMTLGLGAPLIPRLAGKPLHLREPSPEERPPSPLRPGVYMGRRGQQHVPVFPRKLAPIPTGIIEDELAESARPQLVVDGASTPSESRAERLRQRTQIWTDVQTLLAQDDTDEHLAQEREQYHVWKKKVIESARVLQLEVSRFHTPA